MKEKKKDIITKVLDSTLHFSETTAYLVADYPLGFRARGQMLVWIEPMTKGTGYRVCRQTSKNKQSKSRKYYREHPLFAHAVSVGDAICPAVDVKGDYVWWYPLAKPVKTTGGDVYVLCLNQDDHVKQSGIDFGWISAKNTVAWCEKFKDGIWNNPEYLGDIGNYIKAKARRESEDREVILTTTTVVPIGEAGHGTPAEVKKYTNPADITIDEMHEYIEYADTLLARRSELVFITYTPAPMPALPQGQPLLF